MSYSALPPEVNSTLMYSGAGSSALISSATAWNTFASELAQAASAVQSTVTGLAAEWSGPSSLAMTTAMQPYTTWLTTTSAYATQMGAHAATAASLYEAAHAATVPPPVIAANRTLLMQLVATNILGQNFPAIAATEAQYMQMWVQDGVAMDTYAGLSQTNNAQLQAPQPAPSTGNPATTQTSAPSTAASTVGQTVSNVMSQASSHGSSLSSATSPGDAISSVGKYSSLLTTPMSAGSSTFGILSKLLTMGGSASGAVKALGTVGSAARSLAPLSSLTSTVREVAAGVGRASLIGNLSVPTSWASSAPVSLASSMGSALPTSLSAAAAEVGAVSPASALAPLGAAGRAVSQAAAVNAKVIGIIPKLVPEYAL